MTTIPEPVPPFWQHGCCGLEEPHVHVCCAGVDILSSILVWAYYSVRHIRLPRRRPDTSEVVA